MKWQRHNLRLDIKKNMAIDQNEVNKNGTVVVERTVEVVKHDLDKAYKAGDFAQMAVLSREMTKLTTGAEKAAKEAKVLALVEVAKRVKSIIDKAIKPMVDAKELDSADGVWYVMDFGEKESALRLTKTTVRKSTTGEGRTTTATGAKTYDKSTDTLLAEFGSNFFKVNGEDTTTTLQAQYDSSTDKNSRFGVRKQLIKLDLESKSTQ